MGGLGEECGVLYVDAERKVSVERLAEIAVERCPEWFTASDGLRTRKLLSQTRVVEIDDPVELAVHSSSLYLFDFVVTSDRLLSCSCCVCQEYLAREVEALVEFRTGLIILDSIASLTKRKTPRSNVNLVRLASELKRIASVLNVVVIITNQV